MTTLIDVAGSDPGFIKGAISMSGTTVSVRFHKWDAAANAWTPVTISTENTLGYNTDGSGLVGAGFNVARTAKGSAWYADIMGDTLFVNRDETFEAALWAPLMEKAYVVFAETYGQYGGLPGVAGNSATSGDDVINGGIAQLMYSVLYGPRAATSFGAVNDTPGSDIVLANQTAIENLLRVSGRDPSAAAGSEFLMTATIGREAAMHRLSGQVEYILGLPTSHRYRTLRTHLESLQVAFAAWTAATTDAEKRAAQSRVASKAGDLCQDDNWPLLHSDNAPEEYTVLNEFANVVANISDDEGGDQRMIYAWHFYSVRGATFQDKAGAAMALDTANVAAQLSNIDGGASQVTPQNPHHGNEPDQHGTGAEGNPNDGVFTLSLEQYLRNFAETQQAKVSP
jgi:hypothetical protein